MKKNKDSINESDLAIINNVSHLSSSTEAKIIIDTQPPTAKSFVSSSDKSEIKTETLSELKKPATVYDINEYEYLSKMTDLEKTQRQQLFMKKYGFLSIMISQIFQEMKRSAQFYVFKLMSPLITDENIALYLSSTYKIFSILLEGDISSKVWLIKN